jgi:hypothetical protein
LGAPFHVLTLNQKHWFLHGGRLVLPPPLSFAFVRSVLRTTTQKARAGCSRSISPGLFCFLPVSSCLSLTRRRSPDR